MQKETLKAFLQDKAFREKLKTEYNLSDEEIDNISMTTTEDIIELIVIKTMIKKHADGLAQNSAAAQINNLLNNRL